MRKTVSAVVLMIVALAGAQAAQAVTVEPDSFGVLHDGNPGGVDFSRVTFPPGSPTYTFTTEYNSAGLIFQSGQVAAYADQGDPFGDDPDTIIWAWAGVSGGGSVDLVSAIDGYFVVPNTATLAVVGSVQVSVGLANVVGGLQLEVFDISGALIAGATQTNATAGNAYVSMTATAAGIHHFRVSLTSLGLTGDAGDADGCGGTADCFGLTSVTFGTPTEPSTGEVPLPATVLLVLGGGVIAAIRSRVRRAA